MDFQKLTKLCCFSLKARNTIFELMKTYCINSKTYGIITFDYYMIEVQIGGVARCWELY